MMAYFLMSLRGKVSPQRISHACFRFSAQLTINYRHKFFLVTSQVFSRFSKKMNFHLHGHWNIPCLHMKAPRMLSKDFNLIEKRLKREISCCFIWHYLIRFVSFAFCSLIYLMWLSWSLDMDQGGTVFIDLVSQTHVIKGFTDFSVKNGVYGESSVQEWNNKEEALLLIISRMKLKGKSKKIYNNFFSPEHNKLETTCITSAVHSLLIPSKISKFPPKTTSSTSIK